VHVVSTNAVLLHCQLLPRRAPFVGPSCTCHCRRSCWNCAENRSGRAFPPCDLNHNFQSFFLGCGKWHWSLFDTPSNRFGRAPNGVAHVRYPQLILSADGAPEIWFYITRQASEQTRLFRKVSNIDHRLRNPEAHSGSITVPPSASIGDRECCTLPPKWREVSCHKFIFPSVHHSQASSARDVRTARRA
jgi:hypothetical protein